MILFFVFYVYYSQLCQAIHNMCRYVTLRDGTVTCVTCTTNNLKIAIHSENTCHLEYEISFYYSRRGRRYDVVTRFPVDSPDDDLTDAQKTARAKLIAAIHHTNDARATFDKMNTTQII